MKHTVIAFCLSVMVAISACHENPVHGKLSGQSTDTFSLFIPVDTANKMLGSYLNSINYLRNDTDLQSLTVNVAQLRRYIDSMPGSDSISSLKLMFAHTLAYSNSANANTNAGYSSNGLTLIIAGYTANGNYVFYTGNTVLDYAQPCPPICPVGQAASPLLPTSR